MNRNFALKLFAFSTLFILLTTVPAFIFSIGISGNVTQNRYGSSLGASVAIQTKLNVDAHKMYPQTLPYYEVLSEGRGELVDPSYMTVQSDIPSEDQAKSIANIYVQSQGGLPGDAVLKNAQQLYLNKCDYTTGQVVETYPLATEVTYRRKINGMDVVGPGDFITVSIGGNGKVLCYLKTWRALQMAGNIDLISVDDATAKLENGEIIEIPLDQYQDTITINEISLGYFSKVTGDNQKFYKPVWIFRGNDAQGEATEIYVDATVN